MGCGEDMADYTVNTFSKSNKKDQKGKKIKKRWFKGLKAEFQKIIWIDKQTLGRKIIVVVVISAMICALITLIDSVVLQFIEFIIK